MTASKYHVIPSKRTGVWQGVSPSERELWGKINEARTLVGEDKWLAADPVPLESNWQELERVFGVETTLPEDRNAILLKVLQEVNPSHYAGTHPPQPSYKETVKGVKGKLLYAFSWKSAFFKGQEMYFKFCIFGDDKNRRAGIFSLHTSTKSNVN